MMGRGRGGGKRKNARFVARSRKKKNARFGDPVGDPIRGGFGFWFFLNLLERREFAYGDTRPLSKGRVIIKNSLCSFFIYILSSL
jgi:hypothetical protein